LQFSRDWASGRRSQVAGEGDEFFYVNPTGRFVIGGPDGDAGLRGEKSTPETLTTACHAASWLARS
jgi:S-adenosylmethionine synthetase